MSFVFRLFKLMLLILIVVGITYLTTIYLTKKSVTKPDIKPNVITITNYINISTFTDFIKSYNKSNKDEDIHIIMKTIGGTLSYVEAICNCILNHTGKGKIICYVPYYVFSGGTIIALCCDEIITTKNSVFGPCDAQVLVNKKNERHPASSISEVVSHKKNKNDIVNEIWLTADLEAQKAIQSQKKFVEKLCKVKQYNETDLYNELFSGKYYHDEIFTSQDLNDMNLNLNISIVDMIPDDILEQLEINSND